MPPKVSVNICCYNSEKFIKETVQSVLDQTFEDFEIIVIDDGSKDRTGDIIDSFGDKRIKYYYQENKGLSASRNRAVELSSGEYIALLDHDDLWMPEKLEKQTTLLDSNSRLGLVYSDAYIIGSGFKDKKMFDSLHPQKGYVTMQLIKGSFIPCPTVVMRKSFLGGVSPFLEELKIAEEYEYFLRLSQISEFDYIDIPLAKYRIHESNSSLDEISNRKERLAVLKRFLSHTNESRVKMEVLRSIIVCELFLFFAFLKRCCRKKK